MSHARRSNPRWLVSLFLAVIFCVLLAAAAVVVFLLPQKAAETFGAPDLSLSWSDRLLYAVQLFYYQDELTRPMRAGGDPAEYQIEYGAAVPDIAAGLQARGLIPAARPFELYLAWSGLDRTIQAGQYRLEPGLSAMQIVHAIQDATPAEVPFVILAGWRMEEIANALPTSGLQITPQEFMDFARKPAVSGLNLPPGWKKSGSLEGIFLPGQYTIPREAALESFVAAILDQFNSEVRNELEERFAAQGLTFREGIILASIVEKEAVVAEEQPMIASVFLNRLAAGMRLESDPTVQYALGYDENSGMWWKNPLSLADLAVDSAYNTYMHTGLPPGPICSPSLSAIRAVIAPAQTDYLYFRAACDGSGRHKFAYTYEEHLQNACE